MFRVSRRFVRMDVLSGRRFVRTALDVLSGRHFVRVLLRMDWSWVEAALRTAAPTDSLHYGTFRQWKFLEASSSALFNTCWKRFLLQYLYQESWSRVCAGKRKSSQQKEEEKKPILLQEASKTEAFEKEAWHYCCASRQLLLGPWPNPGRYFSFVEQSG